MTQPTTDRRRPRSSDDASDDGPRGASRRQYLGVFATTAVALAGCAGGGGDEDDDQAPVSAAESLQLGDVTLNASFPIELRDPATDDIVTRVHYHPEFAHWHRQPLELQVGSWRTLTVVFQDQNREAISIGADGYQLSLARSEETPEDLVEYETSGERVEIRGTEAGGGELFFRLLRDGEVAWTAPPLPVKVS
jgi:hypothetical protein